MNHGAPELDPHTKSSRKRRAHLIFNPVAGQGNADAQLFFLEDVLHPHFDLTIELTQPNVPVESMVEGAIAQEMDAVFAAGGDGTISGAAHALLGTSIPLGVIPVGTANAFAAALGIPGNLDAVCQVLIQGHHQLVDTARCNGRTLILLAGIGLEAETAERASREAKNRLGALAYLWAGLQQLQDQEEFQVSFSLDGQSSDLVAKAITIANAAPSTSILAHGTGAVIADDGLLDITIAHAQNRLEAFNALVQLFSSALTQIPPDRENIIGLRGKHLKIETDPPQKVVLDGEMIGTTPVEITCDPKSLRVFVPLEPEPEAGLLQLFEDAEPGT